MMSDEANNTTQASQLSPIDQLLEEADSRAWTIGELENPPDLARINGFSEILELLNGAEESETQSALLGEDIIVEPDLHLEAQIRGHYWQSITTGVRSKGRIILLPGFAEFCEKYAPIANVLVAAGYDVLIVDWPGQGRSGHLGAHPLITHCDGFDMHRYAVSRLLRETGIDKGVFHVIGHSMGGYFGLHMAHRYPRNIRKLVLCAPMFLPLSPPIWIVKLLTNMLVGIGRGRHQPPFWGRPDLNTISRFRINNPLTRDPESYERPYEAYGHKPELFRVNPSVGWIKTAFDECTKYSLNPDWLSEIIADTLLCMPGDERIVDGPATLSMSAHLKGCRTVHFHGARHELFAEVPAVRRRLLANILTFLNEDNGR